MESQRQPIQNEQFKMNSKKWTIGNEKIKLNYNITLLKFSLGKLFYRKDQKNVQIL